MPLKYRLLIKILNDNWYKKIKQRWSHQKFVRDLGWIIHIPEHKEIAVWTAKNIIKSISNDLDTDLDEIMVKYGIKF